MKIIQRSILLFFVIILIKGCEDNSADTTDEQDGQPSLPTGTPIIEGRKVYISGFYQDSSLTQMVACFWVDGARVDLEYGAAEAITVENGEIYVNGQWFDSTG